MSDQYDGARAMSAEELRQIAEQQGAGMRNALPACEHERLGAQQNMNAWMSDDASALPASWLEPKQKLTLWQRFRAWRERTGFLMDGRDGGM